ncbi:MAG: transcriptional regulator NrdR, partial [Oscillospiraceae bacterium]
LKCGKRFTTYEIIETTPIIVIKRDGSRDTFNSNKLLNGLMRACEKRPVSISVLEKIVDEVELTLQNSLEKEIKSTVIGELALSHLKKVDQVAYIRFASVYRNFEDVQSFVEELKNLE